MKIVIDPLGLSKRTSAWVERCGMKTLMAAAGRSTRRDWGEMPIPVTVFVDTGDTVLSVGHVGEVLADFATIFALSALLAKEEEPVSEPLDIYLSQAVAGSLWVELLIHPEAMVGAKAAGTFIAALAGTPYLAALPQRIRSQWYRRAAEAESAKLAYMRVRQKGEVFAAEGRLHDVRARTGRQRRRPGESRQTTQQD